MATCRACSAGSRAGHSVGLRPSTQHGERAKDYDKLAYVYQTIYPAGGYRIVHR